jgi:hypothetical protein
MNGKAGSLRRLRDRYPGPWTIERTPSGFTVMSGSTTLLYIYVHTEPWQSVATTGQHRLTWEEGLALAEAIVTLSS